MEYLTTGLTAWPVFAVGCAFAAEKRGGNSLTWFILGLIFGPLAFIVAIVSGKRCPHCLSTMPKEAKVCASCGKDV